MMEYVGIVGACFFGIMLVKSVSHSFHASIEEDRARAVACKTKCYPLVFHPYSGFYDNECVCGPETIVEIKK